MTLLEQFNHLIKVIGAEQCGAIDDFRAELEAYVEEAEETAEELNALECAGVDNWGGYEEAQRLLREWRGEEED